MGWTHSRHHLPTLRVRVNLVIHIALSSRLRVILLSLKSSIVLTVNDEVFIGTHRLEPPTLVRSTVIAVEDCLAFVQDGSTTVETEFWFNG